MIHQPNGPLEENVAPAPEPAPEGEVPDVPQGRPGRGADPGTDPGRTRRRTAVAIVAVCVTVGVVFGAAYGIGVATGTQHSSSASAPATSTTASGGSRGPAATPSSLSGLLVQPRDTTSALSVHLLPGGDQVTGQATLDLCSGTFPSESLRVARLQDVAEAASGTAVLSTEAVLYRNAAATAQAFRELRSAAASCPKGPVTSPATGTTITTTVHGSPDGTWPNTASVEREAFSLTTVDQTGASFDSVAVYLRRGRVLLGVYFTNPAAGLPAIDGHTKLADIAAAFAARIARLGPGFVADPG